MDPYLDKIHERLVCRATDLKRQGGGKAFCLEVTDEVVSLKMLFDQPEPLEVIFMPNGEVRVEVPKQTVFRTLKPENWDFIHECALSLVENEFSRLHKQPVKQKFTDEELYYYMTQLACHGFTVVFCRPE